MSRASAHIRSFDGEHVAHAIYCGTSDVLQPHLSHDRDEPWGIYFGRAERGDGRDPWDVAKECDHEPEAGYAYSSYGGGFHWPVRFCRACMIVLGPLDLDTIYDALGDQWPKDGEPPIEGSASEVGALLASPPSSEMGERPPR